MNLNYKRIQDAMPVLYLYDVIDDKDFNQFENALEKYLNGIKEQEEKEDKNVKEEQLKVDYLIPFLKSCGFQMSNAYTIDKSNGNSTIDLVAVDEDDDVEIIIETKIPKSNEFVVNDLNCKAFQEALLYYMRLRSKNNFSLKHIILTNFYEFYIFEAKEFEALFNQKDIKKFYDNWSSNNNLFKKVTSEFYTAIKKLIKDKSITGIKLDLRNYQEDKQLLYKVFHPDFLLNKFHPNDANELNSRFYHELLYLLGLVKKQIKSGNCKLTVSDESLNKKGTLYYNIAKQLGIKVEEDINEDILSIIVIWLNRILFLKLLEANLIRFNDESLQFLNIDKIKNYSDLSNLFFNILAKGKDDRDNSELSYLPYLNSSLFIKQDRELVDIATLSNLKLPYFKNTQIKDKNGKKLEGEVYWINYLFNFLDAFDFGAIPNRETVARKELINSSVLGLIYEELNGFKDGSYFTPDAITSYMCKEFIVPLVLAKFRENGFHANSIDDLRDKVTAAFLVDSDVKLKVNDILKSIKIIDPAVGSGHFLVSALYEMIYIYMKIGFVDFRFKDFKIENDDVIVTTMFDEIHEYKNIKCDNDFHKIQKGLFKLKRSIIINNLFGVDINYTSCEITKLRLWIELLKHSYYKDFNKSKYHDMETLPNIDMNIKCGNSLTGIIPLNITVDECVDNITKRESEDMFDNFTIQEKVKSITPQMKDLFVRMKDAVSFYTIADKENAKKYKAAYEECKEKLSRLFWEGSDEGMKFYIALCDFFRNYGYVNIRPLEQGQEIIDYIHDFKINEFVDDFMKKKVDVDSKKLNNILSCIKNYKLKDNSVEFRFEFPELLDDDGNFKGFDLIIGNPPYGAKINEEQKKIYKSLFKYTIYGTMDTYKLFIEKGFDLLKTNGSLNYIVPISVTSSKSNIELHKMILENCEFVKVSSYGHRPVKIFPNAEQNVSIIGFLKTNTNCKELLTTKINKRYSSQSIDSVIENLSFVNSIDFIQEGAFCKIGLPIEKTIMQKLYSQKQTLKDLMGGKQKVYYRNSGGVYYKIYTSYSTKSSKEKNFEIKKSKSIVALMSSTLFYWFRNSYSNHRDSYIYEFERFPIPNFSEEVWDKLEKLGVEYEKDIEANHDYSNGVKTYKIRKSKHIIDKIDRLICPLYGLNEEETEFIINYDLEFRV